MDPPTTANAEGIDTMPTPERIARIKRPHTMHHYAQPITNQEGMTVSTTPTRRDDDDTTPRLPHGGHRATHHHPTYGLVRMVGDGVTDPGGVRVSTGWRSVTVQRSDLTPVTPELVPVDSDSVAVGSVAPAPAPRPTHRDGGNRP